jgi:hypothetical protein
MPDAIPEYEAPAGSNSEELERATLVGVRLAARTIEHHLTNHLTLTIGYAELLAEDPELPSRLREMAREVLENAQACVDVVRQLRRVDELRVSQQATGHEGPLLDLETPST